MGETYHTVSGDMYDRIKDSPSGELLEYLTDPRQIIRKIAEQELRLRSSNEQA